MPPKHSSMTDDNLVIRVAARGDGVTGDGRYVAHAAPGDRVASDGGLDHGPRHQTPPCQHFPLCGGCQLQHLDEQALGDFVQGRALHALASQQIEPSEIMPVHLSPPHSRRRVALRAGWTGKHFQIGFSTEKSHRIIDLHQCEIMAPTLFALIEPLRVFLKQHVARRDSLQVKMALVDQGVDMLIENWVAEGLPLHEALTAFATEHGLARLCIDEGYGPTPFWEPEPVTVTLGGVPTAYPPFAFLQATGDGEAALLQAVKAIVGDSSKIADLFAGLGTFALELATDSKVYAAEAGRDAIEALKAAANSHGRPVVTEHRDLYRRPVSSAEADRFDCIILDPPRAGAKEQVSQLAASSAAKIAYVSCNPNSFARDAKILHSGGYRLERLWSIGQFRWATHIEMVGEFVKT